MLSQEQLLTEIEIKSVLTHERYYRDSCQWDKLRNSYHPDASQTFINISWITGSIDDFVAGSIEMGNSEIESSHTIQPIEITVKKDKAISISTGSVNVRSTSDGVEYDMISWVRFVSRLTRLDGPEGPEWKMLTFDAIYDRDSVTPTRPQAEKILSVDLRGGARRSYKYLDWSLTKQGFRIKKDLPGTDDVESINVLLSEAQKWLAA